LSQWSAGEVSHVQVLQAQKGQIGKWAHDLMLLWEALGDGMTVSPAIGENLNGPPAARVLPFLFLHTRRRIAEAARLKTWG
jgi:hypothetical protein